MTSCIKCDPDHVAADPYRGIWIRIRTRPLAPEAPLFPLDRSEGMKPAPHFPLPEHSSDPF